MFVRPIHPALRIATPPEVAGTPDGSRPGHMLEFVLWPDGDDEQDGHRLIRAFWWHVRTRGRFPPPCHVTVMAAPPWRLAER